MTFEYPQFVKIFIIFTSCLSRLSETSVPPFLMRSRPKAIRINGRVLSISFHGEALLSQLAVVGGNKTGVFVHKVTEQSAAHTVGISPGAQIVEVSACLKSCCIYCLFLWRCFSSCCCSAVDVRAEPEGSEDGAGRFHFRGGDVGSQSGYRSLPPLPTTQARWYVPQHAH